MNVVLLLVSLIAAPPQTLDEILAKHIDARGGAAKFAAIQSMKLTGRIKLGDGEFGPIAVYATASGKFRMELSAMKMIQGFDGKTAWQGNQIVTGDSAAQILDQASSAIGGPLWESKKRGINLELGGRVRWKGKALIQVKATLPTGTRMNIYLDPATYLEVGEELFIKDQGKDSVSVIEETVSGDKQFAGVLFPTIYLSGFKGTPPNNRLEIQNMEMNLKLDPALFTPPK